uniref:CFA20 domain-containing protein n=1 Tax=Timema bartmani TaxID=61472 RepID=A0A7R9F003_9NEOP|nr:unnamed protein product [Timema bartmani]
MVKKKLSDSFRPILFSLDKKPLSLWSKLIRSGRVKRVDDDDLHTKVIEIHGTDTKNTYISAPMAPMASLDITLPILVMLLKNMDKDLQLNVMVMDNHHFRRRFIIVCGDCKVSSRLLTCTLPMFLVKGWNRVQINLEEFTTKAFGTEYLHTIRVEVHATCRLRHIYFTNKMNHEINIPIEFRSRVVQSPQYPQNCLMN